MINAKEDLQLEHALLENKDKEVRYILNKRTTSFAPSKKVLFNAIYFCSIDIIALLYVNKIFQENASEALHLASKIGRKDILVFFAEKEPCLFNEEHFALLCHAIIAHSNATYAYLIDTIMLNTQEHYMAFALSLISNNHYVAESFISKGLDIAYAQSHLKEIFAILKKNVDPEDSSFLTESHFHKLERSLRKMQTLYENQDITAPLPKNFFGKNSPHIYEYDDTINNLLQSLCQFKNLDSSKKLVDQTLKSELESLLIYFMAHKVLAGHSLNLAGGEAAFEASVIKNHLLFMQKSPKAQQKKAEKIIQQLQNS